MNLFNRGWQPRARHQHLDRQQLLRYRRRQLERRAQLEILENRQLLATITESGANDVLALASALSLTQDPGGSNFYTGLGQGAITPAGDVDYWRFDALPGDRVSIAGDSATTGNGAIYVELRNASDTIIAQSSGSSNGHALISNYTITTAGTYYVKARTVSSSFSNASYSARVDLARGIDLEAEANNTAATATPLNLATGSVGHALGTMAGNITIDTDVDYFNLGTIRSGSAVDLSATLPSVSTLDPKIELVRGSGGGVLASAAGASHATFTVTADDTYYARVSANTTATAGSQALYLLKADITDSLAPSVLSTTLPTATTAAAPSLQFDGTQQYVQVPDSSSLRPTAGVTLEGWVNFSSISGIRAIVAKAAGAGTSNSYALWMNGGTLYGAIGTTASLPTSVSYGWSPALNTWYHVAFTFDESTKIQSLYVNGDRVAQNTTAASLAGASTYDTHPVLIGADSESGAVKYFLGGKLDEVRIWGQARSPIELQRDMARSLNGNESGLAASWRFSEGTGQTAADQTANHNDGDLGSDPAKQPTWITGDGAPLLDAGGQANVAAAIDRFSATFSEDLLTSAATNPNNYSLVELGPDQTLGTGDDSIYALTPSYSGTGSRTVSFAITPNPLQPGHYRFRTLPGLTDTAGNAVGPYTLDFVVSNPAAGKVEGVLGDDAIPGATPLPLTEFPAGSGFFTGLGIGTVFDGADRDYWRFDAEAGDRVTLRIEASGTSPFLYLQNASGQNLATTSGNPSQIQNYTFTAPGTYYVYIGASGQSNYQFRADLARGPVLEVEANDNQNARNALILAGSGGAATGKAAGTLVAGDPGDYYSLRYLNAGNAISAALALPTFGSLALSDTILTIEKLGESTVLATSTTGTIYYTPTTDGQYLIRVQAAATSKQGLRAQYVLTATIADGIAPQITGTSFPGTNPATEFNTSSNPSGAWSYGWTSSTLGSTFNLHTSQFKSGPLDSWGYNGSNPAVYRNPLPDYYASGSIRYAPGQIALHPGSGGQKSVARWTAPASGTINVAATFTGLDFQGPTSSDVHVLVNGVSQYDANLNGYGDASAKTYTATLTVSAGDTIDFVVGYGSNNNYSYDTTGLNVSITGVVGTTTTADFDRFTVQFPEDMAPATVNNPANLDLRAAGPNGTFDDADDIVYTLASGGYSGGLLASYLITDGPLQPGLYRLQVKAGVTDRAGNPLVPLSSQFTVAPLGPFVIENRSNDTFDTATPLGPTTPAFGGSFTQSATTTAVGASPWGVATADFNADGKPDLAVTNSGTNTISLLLGNGDGSFARTDYNVGANPLGVTAADLDADGKLDLVVANDGSNTVSILWGKGDGTFDTTPTTLATSDPRFLAVADLNADGKLDIVAANYNNGTLGVFLQNGTRSFATQAVYATGGNPMGVAAGDFDGDTKLDLVASNYSGNTIAFLKGNGDGTFAAAATFAAGANSPYGIVAGDFNADGKLDLATANWDYYNNLSVLRGNGDGTFATATLFNLGTGSNYAVGITASDLNADGKTDLVLGGYYNRVFVAYNTGNGFAGTQFGLPNNSNYGVAAADFDKDGRPDIAATDTGGFVRLLTGDPTITLTEDPTGSGVRSGYARGNRSNSSDVDYFSFTARAGDILTLAADVPGNPNASSLYYGILDPGGRSLQSYGVAYTGYGQSQPLTLGAGTYRVAVSSNYDYQGEYRLRVTLAPSGTQAENDYSTGNANDATTSANAPTLATLPDSKQVGTIVGAITVNDNADVYYLGNLPAGTTIHLATRLPGSSTLSPKVQILFSSAGTPLTDEDGNPNDGAAQAVVTSGGAYYARIQGISGAGLLGQYLLDITLRSTLRPIITGSSLPQNGTTTTDVIDRFTLAFNEDLEAGSTNNLSHYNLRSAGTDGAFDTADDIVYTIVTPGYASGLSATYLLSDGPLQPGNYRLTVSGLIDRFGNVQEGTDSRTFTVAPLAGYAIENRSNNTPETATPLTLVESPASSTLRSAGARGNLSTNSDADYFSFTGTASDQLLLSFETPLGGSGYQRLNYVLYKPDGSQLVSFVSGYSQPRGQFSVQTLPTSGTYRLGVFNYDNYSGEYRVQIQTATPATTQLESEPNDGISSATALTLATNNDTRFATAAGLSLAGDLDYFNLGSITAGKTIFLTSRKPDGSPIDPVVSIYNAQNGYMVESGSGRPFDGVAQVNITQDGTYYAVIRAGNNTGSLTSAYLLDVQIVPTGSVQFPNLQVTSVESPTGSNLQSGQQVSFRYTVQNVGLLGTGVAAWSDAVVLSPDAIFGNGDDIPLGVVPHSGTLNAGDSYTATPTITLPHGISGDYYLFVYTDTANAVNEYLLEGDNATSTSGTFRINLAPYPDLQIENLTAGTPDASGSIPITWTTANRGTGDAAGGFVERLTLVNVTTGGTPVYTDLPVTGTVASGATLLRSHTLTGLAPGRYQLTVHTDSQNQLIEFNAGGLAAAEQNNSSQIVFDATRDLKIANLTLTPSGGSLQSGGLLTITWTDTNTGILPTSGSWTDRVTVTIGAQVRTFNVSYDASSRGNIAPGASASQTLNFTLPEGPDGAGTVSVIVSADYFSQVAEYNTTNDAEANNTASANIASALAPYPDLRVSGLAISPTNPVSGSTITVSWNDLNAGDRATSGSWYDRIVIQNTTTGQTYVNTSVYYNAATLGNLAAGGGSAARSYYFQLPDGLAGVGTIQATITVDFNNAVYEYSTSFDAEANNDASANVTAMLASAPDLQVTGLAFSPSSPSSGDLITLNWNDVNAGDAATSGSWYDRIVIQNTTTGQTYVNTAIYYDANSQGNLAASGGSKARSYSFRLPDGVAGAGNLTATVTADTYNGIFEYKSGLDAEANNAATASATATLALYPDLQVSDLAISPASLVSGGTMTVSWNDVNAGDRATSGSWYDRIVIQNTTTGQTYVNTAIYYDANTQGNLAASGGSKARSYSFNLPDGAAGVGNLTATVTADTYNGIFEYKSGLDAEANNTAAANATATLAAYPDLQVSGLQLDPAAGLTSGADIVVRWNTVNTGDKPVTGSFYERVIIENTTTGQVLRNEAVNYDARPAPTGQGAIDPGGSRSRSYSYRLPDGTASVGTIRVTVQTDTYSQILEYKTDGTAETNNASAVTAEVALRAYPDLRVTGITTVPASGFLPGQTIDVSWTLTNQGTGTISGDWTDYLFLSPDAAIGGDTFLGQFPATGLTLAPGQSLVRTGQITLPTFGTGDRWLIAQTDARGQVFELDETNNSTVDDQPLHLPTALTLTLDRADVSESSATAVRGTIARNGDLTSALVVTLTSSAASRLGAPATVTIPAGRASTTFNVSPIDNGQVDGNLDTTLTATASGYDAGTAALRVLDDDVPTLTLTIAADVIAENATNPATTATIRRNTSTTNPLLVTLQSDTPTKAGVPLQVTIPAGQDSVTFDVMAVNNTVIDGTRRVTLQGSATGFRAGSDTVDVTDNDIPQLGISFSTSRISEGAPAPAAIGTITRSFPGATQLTVALTSLNPGKVLVPAAMIIAPNQTSGTFAIYAVDNDIVDGLQSGMILARVMTDSAVILDQGAASAAIEVADNDGPSLRINFDRSVISERGTGTATVTRNTPPDSDLVVTLTTSDATEATVPSTVTIPAGRVTSDPFVIQGVNDSTPDGNQPATITATAAGYSDGIGTVIITDIDLPDLRVPIVTVSKATGLTGDGFDITWRVGNNGLASALGSWVDKVYLSTNGALGNDQLLGSVSHSGPLKVGEFYEVTRHYNLPSTPGTYRVYIVTDPSGFITEGEEANNTGVSETVTVSPSYRATVETDLELAPNGTPVPLRGHVIPAADGISVAGRPVTIRVVVRGMRRIIEAISDASGNFTATFTPLPFEAGRYTVTADHPGMAADPAPQDSFTLTGIQPIPDKLALSLTPGTPLSGEITLQNLSDVPLTGLHASLQTVMANVGVTLNVPDTLPGNGSVKLQYTMTAQDATLRRGLINIKLETNEGATLLIRSAIDVVPLVPVLSANPGYLDAGMLRGTQTFVSFALTNTGGAPTGAIELRLPPSFSWLKVAGETTLPPLAPGASTVVTLALTPPSDMPLNVYTGNLVVVDTGNFFTNVDFRFRAISSAVGDLRVVVTDDFTYQIEGEPKVAGAHVRIRDAFDNSIIVAETTTDATGTIVLTGLREGSYLLEVEAEKHNVYRNTIRIAPGITNETTVFIQRQLVTYSWNVVPTEIQDRYKITLESTFETNVPAPVVTIEAPPKLPELAPGESAQIDVTITNHGFIAAEGVKLQLPTLSSFRLTALSVDLGTLPAKSAITVPVTVERLPETGGMTAASSDPCIVPLGTIYFYICGGPVFNTAITSIEVGLNTCAAQAILDALSSFFGGGGGGGGWIGGGGPGGPGGGTISPPPETKLCDNCKDGILKAIFKCAINFIPLSDVPKCIVSIASAGETAISEAAGGGLGADSAADAASAALSCAKALGKEIPVLGTLLDILGCVKGIGSCLGIGFGGPGGGGGGGGGGPLGGLLSPEFSAAQDTQLRGLVTELNERAGRIQSIVDSFAYLFGSDVGWVATKQSDILANWLGAFLETVIAPSDSGVRISDAERAVLLNNPLPDQVTTAMAHAFIDRWNRSVDYWRAGIFLRSDVPDGQNPDFIAMDTLRDKFKAANEALDRTTAEGYEDVLHAIQDTKDRIRTVLESDQGTCATVRIKIDQEAVITRAAFLGTLEINNGNQSGSLEGVRVELDIRDADGHDATDRFAIRGPQLSGITAVDGTGSLVAGGSGSAKYTIIPNRDAAPTGPTVYRIGGVLRYIDPDTGNEVIAPLLPASITVYPDPILTIDYFQQRDVIGDDPFTEPVEPSDPFVLGMLVHNIGKGAAKNFTITTAQPQIIENEKGLLIDFKIIGTQVGNMNVQPTLTANLGSIDPGKTQVAQFIMTSSLQGHFTDYKATFEHLDALGDERLSLIDRVDIHELIHVVRADRPTDDGLIDFLVNDVPDGNVFPETLYMSDGTTAVVNPGTNLTTDGAASPFDRQVVLSGNFVSGWSYSTIADPGGNMRLDRVVRSDGKVLRVGDNVWQTHTTFISGGFRHENVLHLFDHDATGMTYTLHYKVNDTVAPSIVNVAPVSPDPRSTPVTTLDVTFSEPIDLTTFDYQDLSLTLNGGPNLITSAVTIAMVSGSTSTYRISNLDGLTTTEGNYNLTIAGAGVEDFGGNAATNSQSVSWAMSSTAPVVVSVGPVSPDPRHEQVDSITVVFSRTIDPASFNTADLTLTRGGTTLDLTGATVTSQADGKTFVIGNLASLTGAEGTYNLTVRAGVLSTEGASGIGQKVESWVMDTTAPQVQAIERLATNPRNIVVQGLEVTFSEAIDPATFDFRDITLTRNNGANLITSDVVVTRVSDTVYRISNFNWVVGQEGTYRLSVAGAGINDLAGNAATGLVTETWLMDTTRPATPSDLQIVPDRGSSSTDGRTNSTSLTFSGGVVSDVVEVRLFDTSTGTDLGSVKPADDKFSVALTLTPGRHVLSARAIDWAGNVNTTDGVFDVFVDLVAPTVKRIDAVTPSPRSTPVASLNVEFAEAVNPATVGVQDLVLTRNGSPVLLGSGVTFTPVGGSSTIFRVDGLSDVTAAPGTYQLTVQAGGVEDLAGNAGVDSLSTGWETRAVTTLTVQDVLDITPNPRRFALTQGVQVVFSKTINTTSFSAADLTLTRDGQPVPLSDPVTIALVAGTTYRITGLENATAPEGTYVLTVSAAGIQAQDDGAFGSGSDAADWLTDTTAPTVIDVVDVAPDPRESAVSTIDVIFSEPIDPNSFTRYDLSLARDGVAIDLDDTVTISYVEGTTYRVSGLAPFTGFTGAYTLSVLAAGISDVAGNSGTGSVSDAWTNALVQVDQTPPTSAVNPLPAETDSPILVSWSGQDGAAGSGISNFDIYVSVDGGDFTIWKAATTQAADFYNGAPNHQYAFYSIARDRAGNVEDAPSVADTKTTVRVIPNTIQGMKFHDLDADGLRDVNELGLAGWRIYLDTNGSGAYEEGVDPTQVTDASGNFSFTVAPGTYTVAEVPQSGWYRSTPGDPGTVAVTVATGETRRVDFGAYQLATIQGLVFDDQDGDGVQQQGEGGLSGWRIYLDLDNNGQYEAGEPSTLTDASGVYAITTKPGTYTVAAELREGWQQTFPNGGVGGSLAGNLGVSQALSGNTTFYGTGCGCKGKELPTGLVNPLGSVEASSGRQRDMDPSTPDVIDIYYDFRGIGTFTNDISAQQVTLAELAMQGWTEASGGQIRFLRNTSAPRAQVLNIGVGDLAAIGYVSGRSGILALGGGTADALGFLNGTVVWLDVAENWENNYANGDVRGTYDSFTLFLHELGHALGLPHTDGLASGDILNSIYGGERTAVTPLASALLRQVYGQDGFNFALGDPLPGTHQVTVTSGQTTDPLNFGEHQLDTSAPAAPQNLAITPDTGLSSSDGRTSSTAVTLTGTVGQTGLTVHLLNTTTGVDLGFATVSGTTFSKSLTLAEGTHRIQVKALNGASTASLPSFLDIVVDLTGPTANIEGITPSPRKTALADVELTFSEAIDPTSLDLADLTLTRNGVNVPIGGTPTFELVSGNRYRVSGLAGATGLPGSYVLSVAGAGIRDLAGNAGSGTATASWLTDTTAPSSAVSSLVPRQPTLSFDVAVTGTDPNVAPGVAGAGVSSYDIYVTVDGAPYVLWTSVPASNPTATYNGQSNRTYGFQSIARDAAGNIEVKGSTVEAGTYVPDLTRPETVVTTVDSSTSTFTINVTGSDAGGTGLASLDLFVQVDNGAIESVGQIPAGPADSFGSHSVAFTYQAKVDGQPHQYRFYSVGTDGGGNVELPPVGPSADVTVSNITFALPPSLQFEAIDVQKGMSQRSYIRYLDLLLNRSEGLNDLVTSLNDGSTTNDRIRLVRYELNGTGAGQVVPIGGLAQVVGRSIAFDFGADGIGGLLGGNRNSMVGDGYYAVQLDLDGNGSFEAEKHFYRLLGNVNAQVDRIVDNADLVAITAAFGRSGTGLEEDVNGDGVVNALDRTVATRSRGRSVSSELGLDD